MIRESVLVSHEPEERVHQRDSSFPPGVAILSNRGPAGIMGIDGEPGPPTFPFVQAEDPDITEGEEQPVGMLWLDTDEPLDLPGLLPTGGTVGQVAIKTGAGYGEAEWQDLPPALPDGGTAGQTLIKQSATDGDAEWGDVEALPAGSTGTKLVHDGTSYASVGSAIRWIRNTTVESSGSVPTTPTAVPGMQLTNVAGGRTVLISGHISHGGHLMRYSLWVDGVNIMPGPSGSEVGMTNSNDSGSYFMNFSDIPVTLASGMHTIELRWSAQGSTGAVTFVSRVLVVKDAI